MLKDDRLYLGHMLDTARRALRLARGKTRREYDGSEELRLALTHLLQVIGEAARRVSQEFRDAHPAIPWHAIVGMRHKVVHDYMGVDDDIVWRTVTQELEELIARRVPVLAAGEPSP
jgi:uncharacterized protein with HEPN domain